MRTPIAAFVARISAAWPQNEQVPSTGASATRAMALPTQSSQMDTRGPSARYVASRPQKLHAIEERSLFDAPRTATLVVLSREVPFVTQAVAAIQQPGSAAPNLVPTNSRHRRTVVHGAAFAVREFLVWSWLQRSSVLLVLERRRDAQHRDAVSDRRLRQCHHCHAPYRTCVPRKRAATPLITRCSNE